MEVQKYKYYVKWNHETIWDFMLGFNEGEQWAIGVIQLHFTIEDVSF